MLAQAWIRLPSTLKCSLESSRRTLGRSSSVARNSAAMLAKVAEIYDREVQSTIERLMTLLVPALTISLGVLIAGIIGAILSAYQLPV
jgi:hypothetical protein